VRMIELHDHINTTQVVLVNAESIEGVTPFGSGSALQMESLGVICVHETPSQVEVLMKEA
jgi:hypothetical protein